MASARRWSTTSCLLWPDTLSVAADGYLDVTANQLHRIPHYHRGHDRRRKPYTSSASDAPLLT
jgi:hypothetical protein